MRILVVHNRYQHAGGEDSVAASEIELLRTYGHEVELYGRDNHEIDGMSRVGLLGQTLWSRESAAALRERMASFRPDVVHVHNTFPLISPSVYWAANAAGVPVVQTLHNFRLMCPQAMYLRNGRVCESCAGAVPWRSVVHGCYRGSRVQSAVLSSMLMLHRGLGTYQHKVTRYIALNDFCRRKFIEAGLPAERIVIKPNFVDFSPPPPRERQGFLYVGRLSAEKGVDVLASAFASNPALSLRVAGDGPERFRLEGMPGIALCGGLSGDQVREEMSRAMALVMPSIWYENFPRVLVEAMGCGLPVIASRIGALAELIQDGETGILFTPGDSDDLARKLAWAAANPDKLGLMGARARAEYEARYTAGQNYAQLIQIYTDAIAAV